MSLATIDQTGLVPAVPAGPVTLRDELALWQEAFEFAKAIAPTDLVPKEARNNPPAIMARIIKGHELGVPALHALSQIHVIEGRPSVAAELQRALILAKGHELWTEELTVSRVILCGRRAGGEHVQKVTWTMDDAKRANLAGKSNWRSYPRAMLLARASGELGRLMFADVLAGMSYNLEELTDGVIDALELDPGDVTPETQPKPRRTRTTRKSAAAQPPSARTAAAQGPPESPPPPGGPPPPLPGEDGYSDPQDRATRIRTIRAVARLRQEEVAQAAGLDQATISKAENGRASEETYDLIEAALHELAPQPPETAPKPGERHSGPDPIPSETSDEPASVVSKRAQAIAMQARNANIDHHHVIHAVTNGNKTSAKALTAAEGDAVLHAIADIRAGRQELHGTEEDRWYLVANYAPDAQADARDERDRVEEYQERIRKLKDQKAELDRGQQALPDPEEPF